MLTKLLQWSIGLGIIGGAVSSTVESITFLVLGLMGTWHVGLLVAAFITVIVMVAAVAVDTLPRLEHV